MPLHLYEVFVKKHFATLKMHQNNRIEIERDTVTQSNSELWHHLRADIITASKFGPICRMLESTSCSNMVASIRYPKVIDTAAVHFGIAHEKRALAALELKLGKKLHLADFSFTRKFRIRGLRRTVSSILTVSLRLNVLILRET